MGTPKCAAAFWSLALAQVAYVTKDPLSVLYARVARGLNRTAATKTKLGAKRPIRRDPAIDAYRTLTPCRPAMPVLPIITLEVTASGLAGSNPSMIK